jgi:hypothetical protein
MSIVLSGSPQTLTAGYNPVYFYASSTNVTQPDFRYLVTVTNNDTSTVLANLKIKPRYGDDLLEVNLSKILDNDLGCFSGDIDFNTSVTGFTNAPSVGYKYTVSFGEEYADTWYFTNMLPISGQTALFGTPAASYVIGDQINVSNAAEAFVFYDNQFAAGSRVAFDVPTGHTINIGDTIYVVQDAGYLYEQYEGYATVTNTTATIITTDKAFAGSSPVNGGVLYRNYQYDGLHVVEDTGTVLGVPYILLEQDWIDTPTDTSGFTRYYDGRISQNTGLASRVRYVFNGAIGHNDWTSWDSDLYDPSNGTERLFLTTLPDNWTMTLDNDAYLNIWGNRYLYGTTEATLTTYNSTGGTIGSYTILNDLDYLDQTEIINLSVGPRGLNLYHPDIIQNGTFQSTSNWTLFGYVGGSTTISGNTLNYTDAVGDGEGLAWQYGALTVGCAYEVTLTSSNNVGVGIQVGDGSDVVTIVPFGNDGAYTASFTATTEDFTITMSSAVVGQNDVNIDNVYVRQLCPVIDCDVSTYDIVILSGYTVGGASASETLTFNVDCPCSRYTNYPLLFKDRMGSFVPFNFSLNNKQKVNVDKRDTYKKFIGSGGGTSYTYSNNERSTSIYNTEISEEWTLNTDWLTEAEAAYFEELVTSPVVSILINDEYRAVYITDKSYERVRKINKKNIRYSINIQFANDNTIPSS